MKKRGLSDVITTVLIILIALAAVGIIASYLIPMLKSSSSEISAACYNIDVEPVKCTLNTPVPGNVTVNVKRNIEDATLQKLTFVLESKTTGESMIEEVEIAPDELKELQTKQYVLPDPGDIDSVSVSPVVLNELDEAKVCPTSAPRTCN